LREGCWEKHNTGKNTRKVAMTDIIKVSNRKHEVSRALAHDREVLDRDPELRSFVRAPVEGEFSPHTNDEVYGKARIRLVLVERDPPVFGRPLLGDWRAPIIGTIATPPAALTMPPPPPPPPPALPFSMLPPGDYDMVVTSAEAKTSSTNKLMIAVRMQIVNGPHAGRPVWNNFILNPEDPHELSLFFRNMKVFGLDETFFRANPSPEAAAEALKGCGARVTLGHRTYHGEKMLNIERFDPLPGRRVVPPPFPRPPFDAPPASKPSPARTSRPRAPAKPRRSRP
jgi:hypothetical protein